MKKLAIAATLVLAGSMAAHAADLVINEPAVVADPILTNGLYVQLLGGVALGGILEHFDEGVFDHDHDMDAGWALSAGIGYEFDNGLAVEADVLRTHRTSEGDAEDFLTTTSLMGGLKYTFDVTDAIAFYAGAGIGGIWTQDEVWGGGETAGFGYQLKAGVEVSVTENIALVGEYRFQNAFSDMKDANDLDFSNLAPVHVVMAGAKLSF